VIKFVKFQIPVWSFIATSLLIAGATASRGAGEEERNVTATSQPTVSTEDEGPTAGRPKKGKLVIRDIEPDVEPEAGKKAAKPVMWLGVAVAEATEALSSQLGLKPGEGLLVSYVAPESPAAKAEIHSNDVLVDLDGQILVLPMQLRKLVQMHSQGDTVKLTLFRGGKKQTVSTKLTQTSWREASAAERESMPGQLRDLQLELKGLGDATGELGSQLTDQLKDVAKSLAKAGLDRNEVNIEVKRSIEQAREALQDAFRQEKDATREGMEQARKALQDALRQARPAHHARAMGGDLEDLATEGMDIDKEATVIVKKERNSIKTMVKSDDDGSYVIVANPRKHLTAHGKNGKLLFDGDIETEEQQHKVPKEVWEKVKPMLEQVGPEEPEQPEQPEKPEQPQKPEKPDSPKN